MRWLVTSVLSGKTSVERDMNYWDGNGRWSFEKNCQERPRGEETWDRHMREAAMGISGEESSRHGSAKVLRHQSASTFKKLPGDHKLGIE